MPESISNEELMKEIAFLKVQSMKNAKPVFDEKITQFVAAIIVDLQDGTILYSTPPVNEMFGYINGGVEGRNITDLMPERYRSAHGGHLKHFAHNPKPRQMGESQMDLFGITKDNVEFKIEISLY